MNNIIPKEGTQAYDEFLRKAKNPQSLEAGVVRRLADDSTRQVQQQVRDLLHHMIDIVPGQLFKDVATFHEKFALAPTQDPGHKLPIDVLNFRIKFMQEELDEYQEAIGARDAGVEGEIIDDSLYNAEKAFDALIDLVYVALGTAFLHRFPFNDGWKRVQEANMQKVRAIGSNDPLSTRKHSIDVVKPPGWTAPDLSDLIGKKRENVLEGQE